MEIFVKKQGGTPPGKSKYQTTLAFEVIRWALQSDKVSLKSVRWHVSPLPGPLMDMDNLLIIIIKTFTIVHQDFCLFCEARRPVVIFLCDGPCYLCNTFQE